MLLDELITGHDPESIAIRGPENVTYGQLKEHIARYRTVLQKKGVKRGDRVGLYEQNSPAFIYIYFAIVSLGAIVGGAAAFGGGPGRRSSGHRRGGMRSRRSATGRCGCDYVHLHVRHDRSTQGRDAHAS